MTEERIAEIEAQLQRFHEAPKGPSPTRIAKELLAEVKRLRSAYGHSGQSPFSWDDYPYK